MIERMLALSWQEYLAAGCMAYVLFYLVRKLPQAFHRKKSGSIQMKMTNMTDALERCKELFPIQRITFGEKVFTRGMQIRILTSQQKTIEGELIGLSQADLVCVRVGNQIIAHQLEKIENIAAVE